MKRCGRRGFEGDQGGGDNATVIDAEREITSAGAIWEKVVIG